MDGHAAQAPSEESPGKKPGGPLRRLYDWVLSWADSPYGGPALFGVAVTEAIFFPIPPDVLLMALILGHRKRAWNLAFICTLGSVVGGVIGYLIGAGLWDALAPYFFAYVPGFTQENFANVQTLYESYAFMAGFVAGFTPIPFKLFTVTAGVFDISMVSFLGASALSRGMRFFMEAALLWYFGKPIAAFIDRYFNWLALAGGALVVLVVVLLTH